MIGEACCGAVPVAADLLAVEDEHLIGHVADIVHRGRRGNVSGPPMF